jgi:hypothetical protein
MNNYDFAILSPDEFERLSRDLLQKKLDLFIESFTSGRDGGIDLRCASVREHSIIVQVKRYKDFSTFLTNLTKEVEKVKKLNPSRYIITTSLGLTPNNKNNIKKLFHPFILSTEDILGRDDLNNLLSQYADIEKKYYKLWLASSNVLQFIVNNKNYQESILELERIHDQVHIYVQNESFNQALDILKKNKYVIISGIPGIGKTTLARMLTLNLLDAFGKGKGLHDNSFIYITKIDDAYTQYQNNDTDQVFLFDDFLGATTLDVESKESNRTSSFISTIHSSHNKYLILTTREYILNEALNKFESKNDNSFELTKYIIDLSKYTRLIKAKILFNHLYFSNIQAEILNDLLHQDNYNRIIQHRNFSPRIIKIFVDRWKNNSKPEDFTRSFLSHLDNPQEIWRLAFENLDIFSRDMLLIRLTFSNYCSVSSFQQATSNFCKSALGSQYDPIEFRKSLRKLENTFVCINKIGDGTFIEYQNPSIKDFLTSYSIDNKLLVNLIPALFFEEQFFSFFSSFGKHLTTEIIKTFSKRLENNFDFMIDNIDIINFLWKLNELSISILENFIYEKLLKVMDNADTIVSSKNVKSYINLLFSLKEKFHFDEITEQKNLYLFIEHIIEHIDFIDNELKYTYHQLRQLEKLFPNTFMELLPDILEKILFQVKCAMPDVELMNNYEIPYHISRLEQIEYLVQFCCQEYFHTRPKSRCDWLIRKEFRRIQYKIRCLKKHLKNIYSEDEEESLEDNTPALPDNCSDDVENDEIRQLFTDLIEYKKSC